MTTRVKVAIIGALGTIIAAIVAGLLQWASKPSEDPGVVAERTDTPPSKATPRAKYDEAFSPESVQARRSLRGNLRILAAAESELRIEKVPAGAFGFAHHSLFVWPDWTLRRVPNGRFSFEVHKPAADQVFAVAFVNADTRRRIELTNSITESTTLYSDMWNDAPYAVRVLLASCMAERAREIVMDDSSRLMAVDCMPQKKRTR